MSDTRLFCILTFVALLALGMLRDCAGMTFRYDPAASMVGAALMFSCGLVAVFGRRHD